MGIEYKAVNVTDYVSITGVEDNVGDIIEPGAYKRTLTKRAPKGVWGHQWLTPTSKTIEAKELMPGDSDLPKKLSDGSPWPKEAGALRVKMKFNLDTPHGRNAYSDVLFFDDQQEWSIGYTVPKGMAYKDAEGRRRIKDLDLFEYSAVLFGANSHARTALSVKEMQFDNMREHGISEIEIKSLEQQLADFRTKHDLPEIDEAAGEAFEADEPTSTDEVTDGDPDSDEEDELENALDADDDAILDIADEADELTDEELDAEEIEQEEKDLLARIGAGMSIKDIRSAYNALGKLLDVVEPDTSHQDFLELGVKAFIEAKAIGYNTVLDAVKGTTADLDPQTATDLIQAASDLDSALSDGNADMVQKSANFLLDVLETAMEETADDVSLKTIARTVGDKTSGGEPGDEEEDDEYEDEEEDEEEEEETKSLVFMAGNGVEYKRGPWAGRYFGGIVGGVDLSPEDRTQAFISTLPNRALAALETVLGETRGEAEIKSFVVQELANREYTGLFDVETKMRMTSNGGGQDGRGGGRHRQAAEGRTAGSGLNFGETGARSKPSAKVVKRPVKGVKKPGTSKKTVNIVRGTKKVVNPMAGGDRTQYKNYTMPDGSFPIPDVNHLKKAVQAFGRAKDKEAAKKHIKSRAKALGREDLIPDEWKSQIVSTIEVKGLSDYVNGL
jgi:hypothetical protein